MVFMAKQTTFKAADAMSCGNISLTYGIMEVVRKGFHRLDLYTFLDGFKDKGVPLSYVIELMCIHQLSGDASMNKCEKMFSNPIAREEVCHGWNISRKTMERGLELLDIYLEEVIGHLWKKLQEIYPDLDTDVYVDGSHIRRYGAKGEYTAAGEGGPVHGGPIGRFGFRHHDRRVSGQLERPSAIRGFHPAADVHAEEGLQNNHGQRRVWCRCSPYLLIPCCCVQQLPLCA